MERRDHCQAQRHETGLPVPMHIFWQPTFFASGFLLPFFFFAPRFYTGAAPPGYPPAVLFSLCFLQGGF